MNALLIIALYVVAALVSTAVAWLLSHVSPHPWFTAKRAVIAIIVAVLLVGGIQYAVLSASRQGPGPTQAGTTASPSTRAVPEGPISSATTTQRPAVAPKQVAKVLSSVSTTNMYRDDGTLPYFAGYVEHQRPQDINGHTFAQNLNFPYICSDTSDKFADYNLGRDYEQFTATVGPSDISKGKRYQFDIWVDDRRVYSKALSHGQSEEIKISVQNALKLRLAACSLDEGVIMEREGGAIFGDPQVIGFADKVPSSRPS